MCLEDLQGLTLSVALSQRTDSSQHMAVVGKTPQPEHSNQPIQPLDDGCFCCCHHVVPQQIFVPPIHEIPVELIQGAVEHLQTPTLDPPYRPPRFS